MERSRFAGCRCIAARGRHITLTLDRSDARRGSAYRFALDGNDVHATPAPTVIESSAARIDEASDPSVSPVRPASAMALRRSRSSGTSRAACWRESNQRAAPVRVCPRWCGDRSTSRSSGSQLPILQRSIWPAFACNGETSLAEPLPSICRSLLWRALSPIGCSLIQWGSRDILHDHLPDVVSLALQHRLGAVYRHADDSLRRNEG
jgi:hypothetical protein